MVKNPDSVPVFRPGFRFSAFDAVVLLAGGAFAGWAYQAQPLYAGLSLFVLLHFFLFCNLVRMSRIPELIWAACFVVLNLGYFVAALIPWWLVFKASAIVTLMLIWREIKQPGYHGIGWQKINPNLRQWFTVNRKAA